MEKHARFTWTKQSPDEWKIQESVTFNDGIFNDNKNF